MEIIFSYVLTYLKYITLSKKVLKHIYVCMKTYKIIDLIIYAT